MNTINNEIMTFLLNNHKPGILTFVNEVDQRILVVYRKSIVDGITTFLKEVKEGSLKYKDLEQDYRDNKITINILETFDEISDIDLRLQHTKYVNLYSNYKHYDGKRRSLSLRLKTSLNEHNETITVYLVNKSNKKIVVGYFKNFRDSEEFISVSYPDIKNIHKVVYHESSLKMRFKEEYL